MSEKVKVSGNYATSINYAMQQNYVPIIRNLVITNDTEEVLDNIVLKITTTPCFSKEYKYDIKTIPARQSIEITPIRIMLNIDFLFLLTEKIIGTIEVSIHQEGEQIFSYDSEIELLAMDQWSGLLCMPEILTAFVTPNHPSIQSIIGEASKILDKWTSNPSFTGYQSRNSNNVKLQMGAIYTAIQNMGIIYNGSSASYEKAGQRVRLPHAVLEQHQGNCLDLTILYATCLEAVSLHPLIVIIRGHAFGGCWIEEDTFSDCIVDDISSIVKRMAEGAQEILLVECTDMVAGKQTPFDSAIKRGANHLVNIDEFECVIDVKRSRGSGIRPMPLLLEQAYTHGEMGETNSINSSLEEANKTSVAPGMLDNSLLGRVTTSNEPITKQKVWERKLLDFSLRNTLLNFRVTKNSIQLMVTNLGELEDRLVEGKDFRIMEVPSECTMSIRDAKMYEIDNDRALIQNIATEEFKSYRIRTFLEAKELEISLKGLYRSAKVSMEENGTNTLFLALGFLKWYESDISEKARYAPIVLIPIDIVRSTIKGGYVLRSRQEDAQVNITLIEYLRQDHGVNINGLDPLPEDDHGIDLALVFHTVRQAIMSKKKWNIEETAFVGLFSFGQFIMWNDIRNRSKEIEENKVVSGLIAGHMTWEPKAQDINADNLDEKMSLTDMAVPLSADSSQLVAIVRAASGESFVLHGPPGTGKSQTITNMIANALYNGKSVLFVAEKMAALSVVQKRLASIGLDPFCLELHSNKANKSSVLEELNKALEVGRIKAPEEYLDIANKLHEIRVKLNDVVSAIHTKREYGCSLYDAIEISQQNIEQQGKIIILRDYLKTLDKDKLDKNNEIIRQYSISIGVMGEYAKHPLKGYEGREYSIELRDGLRVLLDKLIAQYYEVKPLIDEVYEWSGVIARDKKSILAHLNVIDAISQNSIILNDVITSPNYISIMNIMTQLVNDGYEYNTMLHEISETFDLSVLDYDSTSAYLKWKNLDSTWFVSKALGQNKLIKELNLYSKSAKYINKSNILDMYNHLNAIRCKRKDIADVPADVTNMMAGMFLGINSDWNMINQSLHKTNSVKQACDILSCHDMEIMLSVLRKNANLERLSVIRQEVGSYVNNLEGLVNRYSINLTSIEDSNSWDKETESVLIRYRDNINKLRDKVAFNQIRKELIDHGLDGVDRAYCEGRIDADNLYSSYMCNLYYGFVLMTISEDERMSDFNGKQYDDIVAKYKEVINTYQQVTVQELVARLSEQVPNSGVENAASSEMGIIKRAIKNNGRMLSLRRLFEQIPTLLRKLCPCMLMSPISVAQYIDPSYPKFDLVIFDEASQLPTGESVGTIARGENVVVVGDPKQLPPTNFFSSNRIDEDNVECEDLESLLDDCLAISMPQEYLKWHYRSRHESLIAYSNMTYYDNKLYTFPSPRDLVSEVKMIYLEGYYDKGKTKHNKVEARAIVDEILRRLRDDELSGDSIGVVTFSMVQQNLIDDMLMEEYAKYPELEERDRNSAEPIFIKNLENVQGDERDVILFSIGYGPDQDGKVSMNFGPLNRDGGWRRLNVAISRARKSMIVYSVLRPEQIDLSRTRSEGVAGLKGFLEFAHRGQNILPRRIEVGEARCDYLVEIIADNIRQMGYVVKTNIGASEFKMDIGIVNPNNTDTYILGIMIDGENCNEASTARDRFVSQPSVLMGLGWRVMRVWTLDWLDDRERVKCNIKDEIDKCMIGGEIIEVHKKSYESFDFEREELTGLLTQGACKEYISAEIVRQGNFDEFFLPRNIDRIRAVITEILEKEAPISRKLLMSKVYSAWEITRLSSRVENVFALSVAKVEKIITGDDDRIFFWNKFQNPNNYDIYRMEDSKGNKRSIDDIASQEIMVAICEVLLEQVGLSQEDLIRESAKKFGYSRIGRVIQVTIQYAIESGIKDGRLARLESGNIVKV